MKKVCVFFFMSLMGLGLVLSNNSEAGDEPDKALKGLKIEALWYLDYSIGQKPLGGGSEEDYNSFSNTRGYLTVKKKILPWLGARMTLDMHLDESGDYKVRHKYLYAEVKHEGFGFFSNLTGEIGVGHMPWLDFEEHINPYRCQGTMAIERAGVFNSADGGVSVRGYFGSKLADAEEKTGNHHYDGRYGSWHIGIYNGSGYHAKEQNENKVIEGRFTVRPLPDVVPGLQFSVLAMSGKGNVPEDDENDIEAPDYSVAIGMVSYEHPRFVATGQYFKTDGNKDGTWVNADGDALKTGGYSLFSKVKLPVLENKLSLVARYDHFDSDIDDEIAEKTGYNMIYAGAVYEFVKGNWLMLVYETTDYEEDNGGKKKGPSPALELGADNKIQAVWQVKW